MVRVSGRCMFVIFGRGLEDVKVKVDGDLRSECCRLEIGM